MIFCFTAPHDLLLHRIHHNNNQEHLHTLGRDDGLLNDFGTLGGDIYAIYLLDKAIRDEAWCARCETLHHAHLGCCQSIASYVAKQKIDLLLP
jgi:hypothetical protein